MIETPEKGAIAISRGAPGSIKADHDGCDETGQ
ncbi:hypothetical protein ACVWYO_000569 [Sphingomonas sp. UYP23]